MLLMPSVFRNNLFDDFFDDFDHPVKRVQNPQNTLMRTDVKETEKCYELDVELPGVKKEDVKAQLKDGYLTISAETKFDNSDEHEGKYIRRERYYGKRFGSREELVAMIENYIHYYNNERYQRRFGVLTPMEKYESYLLAA